MLLLSYLFWGLGDMCMAGNISFSPVFPRNEYFSDRIVVDLLRDRRGYLWIGTLDGLLLYNGSGFKCFTRDDLHTGSSAISSIFEDSRGNVWVGTEGGLCMYSMETDTFVPIDTAAQDEARIDTKVGCIREDSSGIIWFSVKSKGLWSYDPRSCAFRQYLCDGKNGVTAPKINSFVIDGNGSFIISVYCGGLLFCRDNFRSVEPLEIPLFDFSSDNFPQLLTDGRNCVYGCSRGYGLCEIFPYTSKANVLIRPDNGAQPNGLCMDHSRRLIYMATSRGLYTYSLATGEKERLDLSNTFGLPSESFSCVASCGNDGLVAGLSMGNVFYSSLRNDFIRKWGKLSDGETLHNSRVKRFQEDGQGNVWGLTASGCGIIRLNAENGLLERISFRGVPEHCDELLFVGDRLWLSSGSCLYDVDTKTGSSVRYSADFLGAASLIDRPAYPIVSIDDTVLFGTALGVGTIDRKTGDVGCLPGLEECNVNGLFCEGDTLLMSTYAHGLVRYDLKERSVVHGPDDRRLLEVTGRRLNGVLKDSMGRIWVATNESGVVVVSPDGSVRVLDSKNTFGALRSDIVKSMQCDYSGTVWVTTENGMTSISSDLERYEHFSETDGLLNNRFISRSGFISRDGTLYFGSRDGFVSFRPDRAEKAERQIPNLYIDGIYVNNVQLIPGNGQELTESLERTDYLSFRHDRNTFSFAFSRPSLPSSSDGYIECRMEGLDREWVRLGSDNVFTCREMSPGKYVLRARSCSNSGELEREHRPLEIVIRPPIWRSTAAISLYIIMIVGCLAGGCVWLWRRLKKEEEERYRTFIEEKLALTPERKMLRAAQMGQPPSAFLRPELSESERRFISKLDSVIESHISEPTLTYGIVAEHLCMGKQSLNLKVKSILGVTVSNYILLYRLFASVPMLSEDDSRVNVVCFNLGFNTPSYFAKCFKNAFGMLPGEFKEL